jgi:hypothetical protein
MLLIFTRSTMAQSLDAEWIQATSDAPLFFQTQWLAGLEENNNGWEAETIRWYRDDGTVIGRAILHTIGVSTQQGDSYVQTGSPSEGSAFRSLLRRWAPKDFSTSVVGPLFATDLEPLFFHPNASNEERDWIQNHICTLLASEDSRVLLIKDVALPLELDSPWHRRGFHPYEVEPLMVLHMDPTWKSMEDYLSSMKTKFRTKAQSVMARSANCIGVPVLFHEWPQWEKHLLDLYNQVESKAGFKLQPFPLSTLRSWMEKSPLETQLIVYLHGENVPVGFRFHWLHRGELHALFVGMDYRHHRELCIYPRMLYDYVEDGIRLGAKSLHLGRTAAEMKSGIGAVPIRSAGLTRAKNPLLNGMIRPFLKKMVPPTYRTDFPFKKALMALALVYGSFCPLVHAQNQEPSGLDYTNLESWAMHPAIPLRNPDMRTNRYAFKSQSADKPAVFYIYPTFYDKGKTWGVDPRDPLHQKEVIEKALPNQAGVFSQSADVYVPYYRQMRIDGYYARTSEQEYAAKCAFDTAYQDVKRAYRIFLQTIPVDAPIVISSHSQGTNHAERLLKEIILPDPSQQKRLMVAYLIGMPIQKNALSPYCLPCKEAADLGCFLSWRTFGKNYYPDVADDSIACTNPITWSSSIRRNSVELHQGILFGTGTIKNPKSLSVEISRGTLQVRELAMPWSVFYRWKNYHIGDYNLYWLNIQSNFELRCTSWYGR